MKLESLGAVHTPSVYEIKENKEIKKRGLCPKVDRHKKLA